MIKYVNGMVWLISTRDTLGALEAGVSERAEQFQGQFLCPYNGNEGGNEKGYRNRVKRIILVYVEQWKNSDKWSIDKKDVSQQPIFERKGKG